MRRAQTNEAEYERDREKSVSKRTNGSVVRSDCLTSSRCVGRSVGRSVVVVTKGEEAGELWATVEVEQKQRATTRELEHTHKYICTYIYI